MTTADRSTDLREQLAEVLAGHADQLTDIHDGTARSGCICGWDNGVHTAAQFAAGMRERMAAYRLHVADALLPAVEAYAVERAARTYLTGAYLTEAYLTEAYLTWPSRTGECGDEHGDDEGDWVCTQPAGHPGRHEARDDGQGPLLAAWTHGTAS